MKYLVTGGTGFLGRGVVKSLLSQGHDVRILDNNFRGNPKLISNHSSLEVLNGDIRDENTVLEAAKGVDGIVHLAFINGTKYFYENPELVVEVGIRGMLNVAEASKIESVKEVILISTSEVYQLPQQIPTPENVQLVIPDILNSRYSYGGAKIASELILINICSKYIDNWKVIRPHNIYGPNMGKDHVIPALIEKISQAITEIEIQGDGTQTRAFCHIDDFVNAFNFILQDKGESGIYNIGVDEEISINQLVKILMKLMKRDLQIHSTEPNKGETTRRCPEISKIRSLGFVPRIMLQEGLQSCLD